MLTLTSGSWFPILAFGPITPPRAAAMMLESVAGRVFVPILLRFALAAVFIYHGLGKVSPEANYGVSWGDKMPNPPPKLLQVLVAWGEVLGGAACALGILTRFAALGLAAI